MREDNVALRATPSEASVEVNVALGKIVPGKLMNPVVGGEFTAN